MILVRRLWSKLRASNVQILDEAECNVAECSARAAHPIFKINEALCCGHLAQQHKQRHVAINRALCSIKGVRDAERHAQLLDVMAAEAEVRAKPLWRERFEVKELARLKAPLRRKHVGDEPVPHSMVTILWPRLGLARTISMVARNAWSRGAAIGLVLCGVLNQAWGETRKQRRAPRRFRRRETSHMVYHVQHHVPKQVHIVLGGRSGRNACDTDESYLIDS